MPLGNPMDERQYFLEGGKVEKVIFTIYVRDVKTSSEFYSEIFEGSQDTFIVTESCIMHILEGEPREMEVVFVTDSVFTFHRRLVDAGAEILQKPMKNECGNVEAVFVDPDGNKFRVLEIN